MKKIIAAFDGLKFSESTLAYASQVINMSHAHLVGVFLEDFTYTSYKISDLITKDGVSEYKVGLLEEKDKNTRRQSVELFEHTCQAAGFQFNIHRDQDIAIQELIHESIYADLLIIDARETLTHYEEPAPTRFIRDLLSEVQCPVLLVPSSYKPIENIIMLYDGEPSSVFAIRMFSYMFPFLKHLNTEVLTVKNNYESLHVPDNKLIKEFIKRHFPSANYQVLKGLPEEEIIRYLKGQSDHTLVVSGSYRRSRVSRWFRTSMADIIMKELRLPLFIAHT